MPTFFSGSNTLSLASSTDYIFTDLIGAAGLPGKAGAGVGGRVIGLVGVNGGETVRIEVGSRPNSLTEGGGATDIRIGGTTLNDRVAVAGGGGSGGDTGAQTAQLGEGGDANGPTAGSGGDAGADGGEGGGQTQGGAGGSLGGNDGSFGFGGDGGVAQNSSSTNIVQATAGGGGDGWFGGGGGGAFADASTNEGFAAGGGGGANYVAGVDVVDSNITAPQADGEATVNEFSINESAQSLTNSRVELSWSAPPISATARILRERQFPDGSFSGQVSVGTTAASNTTFVDNLAPPGESLRYQIAFE